MTKKIVAGVIVTIVALVVCLIPLKEVAYSVTVDYQDTETYYENVTHEVPLAHGGHFLGHSFFQENFPREFYDEKLVMVGWRILNRDEIAGNFELHLTLWAIDRDEYEYWDLRCDPGVIIVRKYGDVYERWDEVHLESGEVQDVVFKFPEVNSDYITDEIIEVYPDKKTITEKVEKQRTVTKQRPETRYKKATLLDYFLRY